MKLKKYLVKIQCSSRNYFTPMYILILWDLHFQRRLQCDQSQLIICDCVVNKNNRRFPILKIDPNYTIVCELFQNQNFRNLFQTFFITVFVFVAKRFMQKVDLFNWYFFCLQSLFLKSKSLKEQESSRARMIDLSLCICYLHKYRSSLDSILP